jgi:TIR domain
MTYSASIAFEKGVDMEQKIEIFLSYSHRDEKLCQELAKYLRSSLQRQQSVSIWYDHQISPGTNWAEEIQKHVYTAQIILLLVSPDYLASSLFHETETRLALERQKENEARVIPIYLRPCIWEGTSIGKLKALPTNGKPVTRWSSPELAFIDITRSIRQVIDKMLADQPISKENANATISSPMSAEEKRLTDLEEKLQEYYLFIQNSGTFLHASNAAEEKAQTQTSITRQWQIISTTLSEYQLLVRKLGRSVPTEILQLLAVDAYRQQDTTENILKVLNTFSISELRLLGFDLGINLDIFLKENDTTDLFALLDYARQHSLMEELTNYILYKRRASSS